MMEEFFYAAKLRAHAEAFRKQLEKLKEEIEKVRRERDEARTLARRAWDVIPHRN